MDFQVYPAVEYDFIPQDLKARAKASLGTLTGRWVARVVVLFWVGTPQLLVVSPLTFLSKPRDPEIGGVLVWFSCNTTKATQKRTTPQGVSCISPQNKSSPAPKR